MRCGPAALTNPDDADVETRRGEVATVGCRRYVRDVTRTVLVIVLCLVLNACHSAPDYAAESAAERHGLRASVTTLRPTSAGLAVGYTLEWIAGPRVEVDMSSSLIAHNLWLLEPSEPAILVLSDGASTLHEHVQHFALPAGFLDRSQKRHDVTLVVPRDELARARTLTVALGNSGLETRPVCVPTE